MGLEKDKHCNINHIVDYGTDAQITKKSGKVIKGLVYIMLEYVPNGLFYDLIERQSGFGE